MFKNSRNQVAQLNRKKLNASVLKQQLRILGILVAGFFVMLPSGAVAAEFSDIQENLKLQEAGVVKLQSSQKLVEVKVKSFVGAKQIFTDNFKQFSSNYKMITSETISALEANFEKLRLAKNEMVTALASYKTANDEFIEIKRVYWLLSAEVIAKSMGVTNPKGVETIRQSSLANWRNNDQIPQLETYNSVVLLLDPLIKDFEGAEKEFSDFIVKVRTLNQPKNSASSNSNSSTSTKNPSSNTVKEGLDSMYCEELNQRVETLVANADSLNNDIQEYNKKYKKRISEFVFYDAKYPLEIQNCQENGTVSINSARNIVVEGAERIFMITEDRFLATKKKVLTITCKKDKLVKRVSGVLPQCPKNFRMA